MHEHHPRNIETHARPHHLRPWIGSVVRTWKVNMGKDLGTYHIRVEHENARGFIRKVETGNAFRGGKLEHPINAEVRPALYEDEATVIHSEIYSYTEGNFSCDCNKRLFIARAYSEPEPEDADESEDGKNHNPCGHTMKLQRLTLIRPDLSEVVIWETPKSALPA